MIDGVFLLAAVIILGAATVSGLAGFGLGIVAIPPLLLLYEPPTVIAIMKVLTLGTTWVILVDAWRYISWRWIARLVPAALAGLFAGTWLLRALDPAVIRVIAGTVVFGLALLLFFWRPHALRERGWMAPLVGLVSGVGSTSVGMAGPAVVLFFTVMEVSTQVFRATTAAYFVALDIVGLPTMIAQGVVRGDDLRLALAMAPVAVLGRWLGSRLVRYVSPIAFRRATLGLLLITGGVSIVTGLLALG